MLLEARTNDRLAALRQIGSLELRLRNLIGSSLAAHFGILAKSDASFALPIASMDGWNYKYVAEDWQADVGQSLLPVVFQRTWGSGNRQAIVSKPSIFGGARPCFSLGAIPFFRNGKRDFAVFRAWRPREQRSGREQLTEV